MADHAHCFQDTFWNKKRVEVGIKLVDLAEQFHVSDSCVSTWLTGQIMPKDSIIQQFCDLFDVDYNTGHSEFFKAHQNYVAIQNRKDIKMKQNHFNGVSESVTTPSENMDVFEAVYGKLSYADFRAFIDACANKNTEDAIKYIYGKVSYDVFVAIINMLEGK